MENAGATPAPLLTKARGRAIDIPLLFLLAQPDPQIRRAGSAAHILGHAIEQAVDEAGLALVVKGVGDIDIFADDRAGADIIARQPDTAGKIQVMLMQGLNF